MVTRLGVCVQNKLNANLTALRAFYYDVLLLTTAYCVYAVHFFLGQFPNMELMLLLLSPLFYLLNCYIFVIASLRLLYHNDHYPNELAYEMVNYITEMWTITRAKGEGNGNFYHSEVTDLPFHTIPFVSCFISLIENMKK